MPTQQVTNGLKLSFEFLPQNAEEIRSGRRCVRVYHKNEHPFKLPVITLMNELWANCGEGMLEVTQETGAEFKGEFIIEIGQLTSRSQMEDFCRFLARQCEPV